MPNNISDIWSLLNKNYIFVVVLQTYIFVHRQDQAKKMITLSCKKNRVQSVQIIVNLETFGSCLW
jgi:hypothetical protein